MKGFGKRICFALSTAFGLGLLPVAPGTWGTLLGVLIYCAISLLAPADYQTIIIAAALVLVCAVSVPLGYWAEEYWETPDPGPFVLDEVAGFLLTVLLFRTDDLFTTVVWVFIFSRAFDIVKPWPVRLFERLPGGWGILVDDLAASVYAGCALLLIWNYVPWVFDFLVF